ncbi:hypothetical protein ASG57_34450 [Bradyrhizobium sp. Leaf396]|nr:hypothetical protein ASG57_34450 [Bradyrhizobium sp. Leaf396]
MDWRKIQLAPEAISLSKGRPLALNGLGQGYVTDRAAELLARQGSARVLVDLGEQRAIALREGGRRGAGVARQCGAVATCPWCTGGVGRFGEEQSWPPRSTA